jgi:hypothetical protein
MLLLTLQDPPAGEPKKPQEPPLQDAVPVLDRWRILFPDYPLNEPGQLYDPYHQNPIKGDYPILGENTFLSLGARSDTTVEDRRLPTPSGVSTARAGSPDFFGFGEQLAVNQDFAATLELYHGETSFRPRDWDLRVTAVQNYNYLGVRENGIVNPDVREQTTRSDKRTSLQEAFGELHLLNVSDTYDFISVRAGIQPFVSDFRGFMFSDTNLGVRVFGTLESNRLQWNLAWFDPLEKDTNSGLNTLGLRDQQIWIANLYWQDFLVPGYTAQASIHASRDKADVEYDTNHFLVRPALLGTVVPHAVNAYYLGWAGDGHLDRINLTHQLYIARGQDEFNQLAGRKVDIAAYLAAIELSYDVDWLRFRASFMWASGDRKPGDSLATGFDSIFDAPNFAGGAFDYWNRQAIRLQGVNLVNRESFLPDLRSSKIQGQLNFVNPGLLLWNAGMDAEILPELKAVFNANVMRFQYTAPLESFTFQGHLRATIGTDLSLGLVTRPLLSNNIVLNLGASCLLPGPGFVDLYENRATLYSFFAQLTLSF